MKIYGFVGKSGTGKSYQAMNVCRKKEIAAIIDDGLFICNSEVMAGHSAKRDGNKMTAIKTAIFNENEDRHIVAQKIREVNPESILVLGTSIGMIEKICDRLQLHAPDEIIRIEDIVDSDAIKTALRQRREQGKHVIPVPTVQVKSQFSGYFMMPLRIFKKGLNNRTMTTGEKSVVRPTYSYMGTFSISDKAVQQIIIATCMKSEVVADVVQCNIENTLEGVHIKVGVIFKYVPELRRKAEELQAFINSQVEMMTAFNIIEVVVAVKALMPGKTEFDTPVDVLLPSKKKNHHIWRKVSSDNGQI